MGGGEIDTRRAGETEREGWERGTRRVREGEGREVRGERERQIGRETANRLTACSSVSNPIAVLLSSPSYFFL